MTREDLRAVATWVTLGIIVACILIVAYPSIIPIFQEAIRNAVPTRGL